MRVNIYLKAYALYTLIISFTNICNNVHIRATSLQLELWKHDLPLVSDRYVYVYAVARFIFSRIVPIILLSVAFPPCHIIGMNRGEFTFRHGSHWRLRFCHFAIVLWIFDDGREKLNYRLIQTQFRVLLRLCFFFRIKNLYFAMNVKPTKNSKLQAFVNKYLTLYLRWG